MPYECRIRISRVSIIFSWQITDVIFVATHHSRLCECLDIQMWNCARDETEEHPAKPLLPLALVRYQQGRWLVARWGVAESWRTLSLTPHCQLTLAQSSRKAAPAPFRRSNSSAYLNEAKIVTGKRYQHHIPELELYFKIKWLRRQEGKKKRSFKSPA